MSDNREIVFISHATPEDNDFTIWLASRLQLLGYEVWIDKNQLVGGEKFWEEIDQIIRYRAIKFLLIYSNNICQRDESNKILLGKLKDGIYKEYSLAESVSKQNKINDFIILLNVDASTYNLFIGADRLNQIPFFNNWADGFKQLVTKLKKDSIPQNSSSLNSDFSNWYENQYLKIKNIKDKNELYYSNWLSIKELPEYFYIYQYKSSEEAKLVYDNDKRYPLGKIANNLSSFESEFSSNIVYNENEFTIKPVAVFKLKISDVLLGFNGNKFPTYKDSENHFKQLLKRVFHLIMKNRGMFWYEMSNKRLAYFYTPANLSKLKVKFEYPYRRKESKKTKTKNLIGTYKTLGYWNFAISVKPILNPIVGYSLKNHLTFTNDGFNVWKNSENEIDKDKIHLHRRSKGKSFFNEEWRDMLLAFLKGLKTNNKISLNVSNGFNLELNDLTEVFWSDFGYYDPKDRTRHGLLSTYDFNDLDEIEDEDIIQDE